jgi:RNAse (barnase) inhibitor barstar
MAKLEVDLSRVRASRDLHDAFATALDFPEGYGRTWNAFWDLISSDHPLPEELIIRGLDHVERILPEDAKLLLDCLGDYNNQSGRICRVAVSLDYDTRMFFVSLEVRPIKGRHEGVVGGYVSCWIKAASSALALREARRELETDGWKVTSRDLPQPFSPRDPTDEDIEPFIRQACVDGAVFVIDTYASDGDE